jgi:hypothetical protein
MIYSVTAERMGAERTSLVFIDVARLGDTVDLEEALEHARRLLAEGLANVTIRDGKGHSISGEHLIACCLGEKQLTPDLRAVRN